ncbi:hypothetical protein BTHE68_71040 (plasmid) [Burkholderia sp. THE68]|nr:hypothetical protein BTHE68_71040 [Burkholderia sp. THE68]
MRVGLIGKRGGNAGAARWCAVSHAVAAARFRVIDPSTFRTTRATATLGASAGQRWESS